MWEKKKYIVFIPMWWNVHACWKVFALAENIPVWSNNTSVLQWELSRCVYDGQWKGGSIGPQLISLDPELSSIKEIEKEK